MPLVLNGRVKKVATLSTGMADLDLVNDYDIKISAPYAISKAAMNMAIGKFNARYKEDGVLFLSISPGFVETGQDKDGKQAWSCCRLHRTSEQGKRLTRNSKRRREARNGRHGSRVCQVRAALYGSRHA